MKTKIRLILGKYKRKLLTFIYEVVPKKVIHIYFQIKSPRWIFIVGSTNSGTTLLHDLLS